MYLAKTTEVQGETRPVNELELLLANVGLCVQRDRLYHYLCTTNAQYPQGGNEFPGWGTFYPRYSNIYHGKLDNAALPEEREATLGSTSDGDAVGSASQRVRPSSPAGLRRFSPVETRIDHRHRLSGRAALQLAAGRDDLADQEHAIDNGHPCTTPFILPPQTHYRRSSIFPISRHHGLLLTT